MKLKKGLIQVYTGDGKGKTTAASGLAIRAAGAGFKVAFFQFFKKGNFHCSEERILKKIKNIKFIKLDQGSPFFNKKINLKKLKEKVKNDLDFVFKTIYSAKYNIVILDEFTYIFKLIDKREIINKLMKKPLCVEIVITGRDAEKELLDIADLVSEVKQIKHYFDKKIFARRGIEF